MHHVACRLCVLSATGRRVTRAFPMEKIAGESTDHAHQRSVWIGAERLSGVDFWENEPGYDRPSVGAVVLKDVVDLRLLARKRVTFVKICDCVIAS